MDFQTLKERFKTLKPDRIPGTPAHLRLAPKPREGWTPGVIPENARQAAALWLWFPDQNHNPVSVFTRRPTTLKQHGGQISLPGGARDQGESLIECALREAEEELGGGSDQAEVLAKLTPLYIPVSGFVLYPFVGMLNCKPKWDPSPDEVEEVYECDLNRLANPSHYGFSKRSWKGKTMTVPHLDLGDAWLWGATAMVVAEGLEAIGVGYDPWTRYSAGT